MTLITRILPAYLQSDGILTCELVELMIVNDPGWEKKLVFSPLRIIEFKISLFCLLLVFLIFLTVKLTLKELTTFG